MNGAISVSDISAGTSRAEQMAYLRDELGLDPPTAHLLYTAERLQGKGQLKQAHKYYLKVVQSNPNCTEALENARMVTEMLEDEQKDQQSSRLKAIQEEKAGAGTASYTTAEMDVWWSGGEFETWEGDVDVVGPDQAAVSEARRQLKKTGHGNSIFVLLSNEVLKETSNPTTYLKETSGRARFRVTLIPDKAEPDASPRAKLEQELFSRIRKQMTVRQAPITESELEDGPDVEVTNHEETVASSSRFADAESA